MPLSYPRLNWETLWAPYDQPTYALVLKELKPSDIVLDIGAGDLRLTKQMATYVNRVYAIEIDSRLVIHARFEPLSNLILIEGDALTLTFPTDITCGILLMRHCTHYAAYAAKLKQAGATRLITNARWHMSVETVDLFVPRLTYAQIHFGWYACQCGTIGFKPGLAEAVTSENIETVNEVRDCPACDQQH